MFTDVCGKKNLTSCVIQRLQYTVLMTIFAGSECLHIPDIDSMVDTVTFKPKRLWKAYNFTELLKTGGDFAPLTQIAVTGESSPAKH